MKFYTSRDCVPEAFDQEKQHSQQQTPELRGYRHVFDQRVKPWVEDVLQDVGMPDSDRTNKESGDNFKKRKEK